MLGCGFKSIIHSVTLSAKDSHGRNERSWKVGVPGHKEGKRNLLSSYFLLHAPPARSVTSAERAMPQGIFSIGDCLENILAHAGQSHNYSTWLL